MGYLLYREVKRYAPADLDTGELALLLIIADEADEKTRECWPGSDELGALMRMSWDGVRKILIRLADRGVEVRVPLQDDAGNDVKDARGRIVYAQRGARTTYRIPRFAPIAIESDAGTDRADGGTPYLADSSDAGLPYVAQRADAGPPFDRGWSDAGLTKNGVRSDCGPTLVRPASDPLPHIPQEEDPHPLLSKPQQILRDAQLGLTPEEEKKIIKWVNLKDRKGAPWWRTLATNGDLPDLVDRWRDETTTPADPTRKPDHCGDEHCDLKSRMREDPVTKRPAGKCPTCHPDTQKGAS